MMSELAFVRDASGELEGTLTMVFDKTTMNCWDGLPSMATSDTIVDLIDVETNGRVDPRLFRLNEDDEERTNAKILNRHKNKTGRNAGPVSSVPNLHSPKLFAGQAVYLFFLRL